MEETFETAYRAHGGSVFAYLVRMTGDRSLAEELCQETFVRFLKNLSRLRDRNGSVAPWLYRVATRLVLDERRRRPVLPLDREPEAPGDAERRAESRDMERRVGRELERLAPELRATFVLRVRQELTFAEVADATGVSERAAKDRFRRARDLLLLRLAPLVREIRS
ncbi:MAG: RNA polymerase sigma factor [Planctomycetota bacterium]|jgi:RNA polymerase sigma-70 factor (ECF subfamily)